MMEQVVSIDEYLKEFPVSMQKLLQTMRNTIQAAAPEATERISYGMPCFYAKGNLVYFAVHKNHIGFYPSSSGISAFTNELKAYKYSKGAIQFPFDKPLPLALIKKIVEYRLQENFDKAAEKERKAQLRICKNGHQFYKSSDCPTCPICEKKNKSAQGFVEKLSAPATRALLNEGIKSLTQLAKYKEADILKLHGVGPSALPIMRKALKENGLTFKK
ncbi:hypothetical protein SanaruYs_36520 [Chryseotalea sanaruensis]|uniref:YdhG-like domain-containing protein n=1 Tax=Chryseotalea sanaruensis TaxID=2482724 RepID=A0A401UES5_9BACT|nr:DUF1801 domain-containing protein [Chryseotalea sanaruensis]GCC53408.1 hypothetical protein SanaruYs_36520 [Chryseotalea sanaruensis]